MRLSSWPLLALIWVSPALAADPFVPGIRPGARPEVYLPLVPEEHERLHFFGRRDTHVVPGAVSINRAPYRCDLDQHAFRDRETFVAHLRSIHQIALEEIPDRIVVRDGLVHFIAR